MKPIEINTSTDLLNFIKRKEITYQQAETIVENGLRVLIVEKHETKEQLIKDTEKYINDFIVNGKGERPIFLTCYLDC